MTDLKDITTVAEYEEYRDRVRSFFEYEKIVNLTPIDPEWDLYFSRENCACCKRNLAGNRVDCNGFDFESKEIKGPYEICVDCLYFAEYGQLDDETMLNIEEN